MIPSHSLDPNEKLGRLVFVAFTTLFATVLDCTAQFTTLVQVAQQAYVKPSNTQPPAPPGFANQGFGGAIAISGDTLVIGASTESSGGTGVNGDQFSTGGLLSGAAYIFVRDGTNWTQQAYLKASNPGPGTTTGSVPGDRFGSSVAVSGDIVVVGSPLEASAATGVNGDQLDNSAPAAGAAYVFERTGTNWVQTAYLKASNTDGDDQFGTSVAVSGTTILVGAPREASGSSNDPGDNSAAGSGAAYIFVPRTNGWIEQAYLKASNIQGSTNLGRPGAYFGFSVAVSSDTAVIGAPYERSYSTGVNSPPTNHPSEFGFGAAYVFVRNGEAWSQQAYVKASDPGGPTGTEVGAGDSFGHSVALSGDTLLVGTPNEDSAATGVQGAQNNNSAFNSGAAYVFTRQSTNWTQQAYLKASNTGGAVGTQSYGDRFGYSVSASGDTLLIGAYDEDGNATGINGNQASNGAENAGAAYLFARRGTNWYQQAYLKASNTEENDRFGLAVAVANDTLVVGAFLEDSGATGVNGIQTDNLAHDSGAAYIFTGIVHPPFLLSQPASQAVYTGSNAMFNVSGTTTNPPLRYQWQFNGTDLPGATNTTLVVTNVQFENMGGYRAVVGDQFDYILSDTATLSLIDLLFITAHPTNAVVRASSNAAFSVTVTSAPPARFQWQFHATILAGQTNSMLTLTNVQPEQSGNYSAVVSNDFRSVTSEVAMLTVLVPPSIVEAPVSATVVAGEDATFSVTVAANTTLPVNYQWRKGSVILTNIPLFATNCSFTLLQVPANSTPSNGPGTMYRVILTNAATTGPGVPSPFFAVTVTAASPPSVLTQPAQAVSTNGANLTGTVNPKGATTVCWFEYGLSTNYSGATLPSNIGNSTNSLAVNFSIASLLPDTVYHYRLVATNRGGVTTGTDLTFSTLPVSPAGPSIALMLQPGQQVVVTFTGASGRSYYLERTTCLGGCSWGTVASAPGQGQTQTLSDPEPFGIQAFYRVRVE